MTTLHLRKSISPECFRGCLLIALALCCFALWPAPNAFGVSPAPDGGYAGANTAEGTNALFNLSTGIANTALGSSALLHDTIGGWNVGIGSGTLQTNISGNFNMAIGTDALRNNTADANMAIGFRTLFFNTTGHNLTAVGANALYNNTMASFNTAVGGAALYSNMTGGSNTAAGYQALQNNNGSSNIALGAGAGQTLTTGSNNIDIGNVGVAGESSTIRIGTDGTHTNTFLAGDVNINARLVPQGEIQVPGAGLDTTSTQTKAVFIHRTTAANTLGDGTVITHPMSDGDPNAILFVTPNWDPAGVCPCVYNNHAIGVYYFGGHWTIFNQDLTAISVNAAFNVMIVKP